MALAMFVGAFPLAPGRDEIRFELRSYALLDPMFVTPLAERLTGIVCKAQCDELGECLLVGQVSDALHTERTSLFREKKMLRLDLHIASRSGGKMQKAKLNQQDSIVT